MKRYSGLHDKLCTIENIEVADDNARKNKNKKYGINKHDKNRQYENEDLVDKLFNLKYKTSKYSLYKIYEPKERIIYRLPYYPDRIAHHAIMNVVKDIWTKSFIHNTYSCIEGRGIHLCANNLKRDLRKYPNETKYCLKLDIKKFYPSIPHNGLKECIRKSIKYKIIRLVNSYLNREIDKKEFKVRMCAYYGWLKHADAKNLLYKIQSLTGVRYSNWNDKRTNIAKYYGKYVRIIQVINYAKYFRINFIRNGKAYYADSRDKTLFYSIHRLNHFPINFKITKYDWRIYTKNRKENIKPQI